MRKLPWLLLILAGGWTGCTTTQNARELDLKSAAVKTTTALLIAYDLSGSSKDRFDSECDLKILGLDSERSYAVAISNRRSSVAVDLLPGRYAITDLSCGRYNWNFEGVLRNGFTVHADKISYIGRLSVKSDNRNISVGFKANPREEHQFLSELIAQTSRSVQDGFVSAYTGKPISSVAMSQVPHQFARITWRGTREAEDQGFTTAVLKCREEEMGRNHLLLGRIAFTARYSKKRGAVVSNLSSEHTYSDEMISCIENSLRDHKLWARGAAEVEFEH